MKLVVSFLCVFASPKMLLGQEIAQKKCIEYAKIVYVNSNDLSDGASNTTTCGIIANPLIIGGTPAKRKEFPHMALFGFGKSKTSVLYWLCGGALISNKHVLTAAHCMHSTYGPAQMVKLGAVRQDNFDSYVQEKAVSGCTIFPEFTSTVNYHDIAVCELSTSVEFTPYVRPACLNMNNFLTVAQAQAIGFGKTDLYASDMNEELQKVQLDIIDRTVCQKYVHEPKSLPENITLGQLCAGNLKDGGKDTCQGDSGGPLQIVLDDPYCMYSLIGVTSFGRFCGLEYSPGIYTNISHYLQWIENVVWNNK